MSKAVRPIVIYDFDPRNVAPEYLRAIGLVAAASSQTESTLRHFIGALLQIDNMQALALTLHMTAPMMGDVVRTLAELDAPNVQELDKIDEILDAVQLALKRRNNIIHGSLAIHPETKEVFSVQKTARGTLQGELKKISVSEIEQDAALIYESGMDVVRFMESRGIAPRMRTSPLRESISRGKKAREGREGKK